VEEHGIWAWDCVHQEAVLVLLWILALLGDNPMQSEFACHIGLRGKLFCRICLVQGKATPAKSKTGTGGDDEGTRPDDEEQDAASDAVTSDDDSDDGAGAKKPRRRKQTVEPVAAMIKRVTDFIRVRSAK
jgi:hypothetical protein